MSDHILENKIYYHDTDNGGVVYYGRYLEHLEEGRTEFLRVKGVDTAEYAKNGMLFPVVHLEIDYKSSARYGDTISIYTRLDKVGNASVTFSQTIKRGETILLTAKTVWACVDLNMKVRRVPDSIRNISSQ